MEEKYWFVEAIKEVEGEQGGVDKILKELRDWCTNNEAGRESHNLPRDEDKIKVLEVKLNDLKKARERLNWKLDYVVGMFQENIFSPADDDQGRGGDKDDDETAKGAGMVPETTMASSETEGTTLPPAGDQDSGDLTIVQLDDDDQTAQDDDAGMAPEITTPSSSLSSSSESEFGTNNSP